MAKRDGIRWKAIGLKDEERLTAGLVHHRRPCWSTDGRWLAFAVGDNADSAWVLTDRRGRVARTLPGPVDGGAAFAPDGGFAFGRRIGATTEIWMTPGAGVPPVRLLGGDGHLYRDPAFSPDGQQLAVACAASGATDSVGRPLTHLLLLELATGARHSLPAAADRADAHPVFSPDGEQLFFEGVADGDIAVHALDLSRHSVSRVTASGAPSRRPAPISSELVVVERQVDGDATRLWIVDRRETRERELELEDAPPGPVIQREPFVHRGKSGKVRVAYTQLVDCGGGEPQRFDVCIARLRGVAFEDADHPHDENAPESSESSESSESVNTESANP